MFSLQVFSLSNSQATSFQATIDNDVQPILSVSTAFCKRRRHQLSDDDFCKRQATKTKTTCGRRRQLLRQRLSFLHHGCRFSCSTRTVCVYGCKPSRSCFTNIEGVNLIEEIANLQDDNVEWLCQVTWKPGGMMDNPNPRAAAPALVPHSGTPVSTCAEKNMN